MAKVVILRSWPDDDDLQVIIEVDHEYPDALAEATRAALNTYAEALGVTVAKDEQ